MLEEKKIIAYAYLVGVSRWNLEPIEGSTKKVVPEEYRIAVAERLVI